MFNIYTLKILRTKEVAKRKSVFANINDATISLKRLILKQGKSSKSINDNEGAASICSRRLNHLHKYLQFPVALRKNAPLYSLR